MGVRGHDHAPVGAHRTHVRAGAQEYVFGGRVSMLRRREVVPASSLVEFV